MSVVEFQNWLDQHGDDISRWPVTQQRDAVALLWDSAEARTVLAEAVSLRQLLTKPRVLAPCGLADRIVGSAAL